MNDFFDWENDEYEITKFPDEKKQEERENDYTILLYIACGIVLGTGGVLIYTLFF